MGEIVGGDDKAFIFRGIGDQAEGDLAEVGHALDGVGLFAGFVEGGEEEGDEDGDDADDYEEFYESKSGWGFLILRGLGHGFNHKQRAALGNVLLQILE
jgi:hypothetical protein